MATETAKKFSDTFIDVHYRENGAPRYRAVILFDDFKSFEGVIPLVQKPAFAAPVMENLIRGNVSNLNDAIAVANSVGLTIPFTFQNCFNLLGLKSYKESGISDSLTKAEIVYDYLKNVKEKEGLSALPRMKLIPYPSRFSREEKKVKMAFKFIELFEPERDLYLRVLPLLPNQYREESNVKMINDFFDSHRDRKDIIERATSSAHDLNLPDSDEESDEEASSSSPNWKTNNRRQKKPQATPRRWEKPKGVPERSESAESKKFHTVKSESVEKKPQSVKADSKKPRRVRSEIDE